MQAPPVTLPTRDRLAHPATLLKPRALAEWIADLPMANTTVTTEQMLVMLRRLNRHPERISRLLQLLECFQQPIHQLLEPIMKIRSADSKTDSALSELMAALTLELAQGYKRLLCEMADGLGESKAAQLITPLYQAIRAIELHRLICFSQYHATSPTLWREQLQLYLYAEVIGVSRAQIRERHQPEAPVVDIRLLLKRNLLLDLLDPYGLLPGHLWAVYRYLAKLGQLPRLGNFRKLPRSDGAFLIDSRGNERHRKYTPDLPREKQDGIFLFDINPLNQRIHEHLERTKHDPDFAPEGLELLPADERTQLLHDLLVGWHIHPSRRHPRQTQKRTLVAINGLTAIGYYLGGDSAMAGDTPRRSPLTPPGPVQTRWSLLNSSLSGVALKSIGDSQGKVQVGQLILLRPEQDSGGWGLGVIRRLLVRGNDDIEIGVQYVPGKVSPVSIAAEPLSERPGKGFQPGLLLQRGGDRPPVLFTALMLYRPGHHYLLEQPGGRQQHLVAGRLLETTRNYQRFEFTPQ